MLILIIVTIYKLLSFLITLKFHSYAPLFINLILTK